MGKFDFTLAFADEVNDGETTYAFVLVDDAAHTLREMAIGMDEDFNGFLSTMEEEYGAHDAGGSGEDTLEFSLYEPTPDQFPEIAEKWKEYFLKRGFTVVSTTVTHTQ